MVGTIKGGSCREQRGGTTKLGKRNRKLKRNSKENEVRRKKEIVKIRKVGMYQ